jgi:tRNA-uridine 2-sulfurtransferase
MMTRGKTVRGLGLISGGLDSMLAARLLMEQGVAVTGVAFVTPFFGSKNAELAAARIGFPLIVRDITATHLAMVKHPPSGYGRLMNPCIDCHALMLKIAGEVMDAEGFDFLFTGEVLNERPMSQSLRSLNRVANLSGRPGQVLRPLSALRLKETLVEREGKVDRARLLNLEGRSRRRQFELARTWGITDYPTPAGGCLLTDPGYSRRLKDLLENSPGADAHDLELLKIGRQFRISAGVKAAVGKNAVHNQALTALRGPGDLLLRTGGVPGPVMIVSGAANEADIALAAGICARYSDGRTGRVRIIVESDTGEREILADPIPLAELVARRI